MKNLSMIVFVLSNLAFGTAHAQSAYYLQNKLQNYSKIGIHIFYASTSPSDPPLYINGGPRTWANVGLAPIWNNNSVPPNTPNWGGPLQFYMPKQVGFQPNVAGSASYALSNGSEPILTNIGFVEYLDGSVSCYPPGGVQANNPLDNITLATNDPRTFMEGKVGKLCVIFNQPAPGRGRVEIDVIDNPLLPMITVIYHPPPPRIPRRIRPHPGAVHMPSSENGWGRRHVI